MTVSYSYASIPDLGTSTAAYDINNLGQITGSYTDPKAHAFIYSISGAPLITEDDPFGRNGTDGYGINDIGQIVGDYADGFLNHAFFYAGGISYSTVSGRFAWDINDLGQIVGDYAQYSSPTGTAFIRNTDGSYTDIRYSQSILTSAQGINDNGEVVGYYQDGTGYHAFTYLNGTYNPIPDASSKLADAVPNETFATGVNNSGWIVGYYYDTSGAAHSFLEVNGAYQTIGNELHAMGVFAQGINDAGQIVGYYNNGSGTHAFLATVSANQPPDAVPDFATVQKGLTTTANVLTNDADPNDPHSALYVSKVNDRDFNVGQAIHGTYGTLTLNADGSYSYQAIKALGSASKNGGVDVFTYTVTDGHVGGDTSTTLAINVLGNSPGSGAQGGTLAADLAAAANEISGFVSKGVLDGTAFHLTDRVDPALVAKIVADVAAQFGSQGNYLTNAQGYINPGDLGVHSPSYEQCVALVWGADKFVYTQTSNWSPGQQVVLNGGPNGQFTPGVAVPMATFVDKHYTSEHAAFFLGYGVEDNQAGFFMLDQYLTQHGNPGQPSVAGQPAEVRFYTFADHPVAAEYFSILV